MVNNNSEHHRINNSTILRLSVSEITYMLVLQLLFVNQEVRALRGARPGRYS